MAMKCRVAAAVSIALTFLLSARVLAQPPAAATKDPTPDFITEMVNTAVKAAGTPNVQEPFSVVFARGAQGALLNYLIYVQSVRTPEIKTYRALIDAMEARADKQIGAAPDTKQSTSVALKGLTAEILGYAVETGALARDVDGAKMTFRARPTGIVKALQGQGLLDLYRDYS